MSDNKQLWMLVGGNGAGKTTFYNQYLLQHGIQFINADLIARELAAQDSEQMSYMAARVAESLRMDYLSDGKSFCFETVFSHPSKIDFIAEAKSLGYEVILVFIHLETDELNQARVAQRVNEGGHSVPSNKIISRIPRTLANVKIALPLVDEAHILDNSSQVDAFKRIATLKKNQLKHSANSLPQWAKNLLEDCAGLNVIR